MVEIFKCIYLHESSWISNILSSQCVPGALNNILAPIRRQTIIWSNDNPVPVDLRIYASPGLNKSNKVNVWYSLDGVAYGRHCYSGFKCESFIICLIQPNNFRRSPHILFPTKLTILLKWANPVYMPFRQCIPWICYERSFSEFYISMWNQLVFNQSLKLFVQSPPPYLLIFAWRN